MKKNQIVNNKKIIGVIVSIVLVMVTALGVTLAYYQDETGTIVNQFSVGNVTTELVEDFKQTDDNGVTATFDKTPKVTNTGANACLVRVRVSITPESVVTKKMTIAGSEKSYLEISSADGTWVYHPENDWKQGLWRYEDGWYYYEGVVQPGHSTAALFENVVVNYGSEEQWEDFDIIIYQEAVQAEVVNGEQLISGTTPEGRMEIWSLYDAQ